METADPLVRAKLRERPIQLSNKGQMELKRIYFGIEDVLKELEMVMAIDEGSMDDVLNSWK
jgi:hypothetical protein